MKKYNNFIRINESKSVLEQLDIDESTITNYFSENYDFDEWHSIEMLSLDYFVDHIDTERLNNVMYSDFKESIYQDDEDEDNVKDFLKNHESTTYDYGENFQGYSVEIDELYQEKIIDELDKDDYDDEESFKEEIEMRKDYTYDEKIDELADEDIDYLKNIIDWDDYSLDKWYSWYNGSGLEWLEMIYGEFTATKRDSYSYSYNNSNPDEDKFNAIEGFIDWNQLDASLESGFEFEYKEEFFTGQITYNQDIQREIFEYNNRNSFLLFDEIDENSSLGKSEEFQESYIEEYLINEYGEDLNDLDEYDKKIGMKDVLLKIDKKFGINDNIESKYKQYMSRVKGKRFNL